MEYQVEKAKKQPTVRAFHTECGIESIVFAETASQARYATYQTARSVGYNVEFKDINVKRAPEYDNSHAVDEQPITSKICYAPEYLVISNKQVV